MSRNCFNNHDDDIEDILENNIGRVVTIFTRSGGRSGSGFTGLLVSVDDDIVRLITSIPSAPHNVFRNRCNDEDFDFGFSDRCHRSRFGTTIVIPIRQIVSVVFNDV